MSIARATIPLRASGPKPAPLFSPRRDAGLCRKPSPSSPWFASRDVDMESAALPLLVSTALLRVALMPLAHAFRRRVHVTASLCGRHLKSRERPRAALHNMMHSSGSFGKPRQRHSAVRHLPRSREPTRWRSYIVNCSCEVLPPKLASKLRQRCRDATRATLALSLILARMSSSIFPPLSASRLPSRSERPLRCAVSFLRGNQFGGVGISVARGASVPVDSLDARESAQASAAVHLAATLAHIGNLRLPRRGLRGTNSADKQFIQLLAAVRPLRWVRRARASVDGILPG
jgi:hypothetical protein